MADDIATLRRILRTSRTIAVVGLSAECHRPSFFAAKYMQEHGYRVVPVNPRYDEILGERCHPTLTTIEIPIDIVDVFRRSEDVMPIAEEAIAIGAKCLWQQIGVKSEAAAALGLFGEEVDGERAVALGLAWAAYDDGDVLDRALALAARVAADPELARRTVASFRRETVPGGMSWDVAVELERSPQMWSLRRREG